MPPRKHKTDKLAIVSEKVGSAVSAADVDRNGAVADIPARPETSPGDEIEALRKQVDALRQQIVDTAAGAKAGVKQAARQTEATVKLYPVSSIIAVAAVTAAFALVVSGLRTAPSRSRYDRTLNDIRELYDRLRERI